MMNTEPIHPIASALGCHIVPKNELDMDSSNKISVLKKYSFFKNSAKSGLTNLKLNVRTI
jgi:hypothetical protein